MQGKRKDARAVAGRPGASCRAYCSKPSSRQSEQAAATTPNESRSQIQNRKKRPRNQAEVFARLLYYVGIYCCPMVMAETPAIDCCTDAHQSRGQQERGGGESSGSMLTGARRFPSARFRQIHAYLPVYICVGEHTYVSMCMHTICCSSYAYSLGSCCIAPPE